MAEPLKLRAKSPTDLALVSTLSQDALISGADMTYDPAAKRFIAVLNRFCWEQDGALEDGDTPGIDATAGTYHRSHCGLVIDRVRGVQSKGIELGEKGKLLNLLSIHALDGCVELMFSGGAAVRLKTSSVLAHFKDLGDRWPTKWRPHHGHDEEILAEESARAASTNPAPEMDAL